MAGRGLAHSEVENMKRGEVSVKAFAMHAPRASAPSDLKSMAC